MISNTLKMKHLREMISEARNELSNDLKGAYSVIEVLHCTFNNIVNSNTVITDFAGANNPYAKVVKILLKVKVSEKKTVEILISENFSVIHFKEGGKTGYERISEFVASQIAYELKNAHILDEDSEVI